MPDDLTKQQTVSKPLKSSRISRDALDGLPQEKFFRIVGLFNAVVPTELKSKNTGGNYENPIVQEFEKLRSLIEQKLRDRDVAFQRDEMGDYVHNLNLLLGELLPLEALESAMPSVRDDYRMRVGAEVYAAYIASPSYKALESCDGANNPDARLRLLKADYIQLVGFSERLMPDMIDRLVDKAGKSDKGASPPPGPTGPRAIAGTDNVTPEKPDANGAQGKTIIRSGEPAPPAPAPAAA